jgi:hypothetical protein
VLEASGPGPSARTRALGRRDRTIPIDGGLRGGEPGPRTERFALSSVGPDLYAAIADTDPAFAALALTFVVRNPSGASSPPFP